MNVSGYKIVVEINNEQKKEPPTPTSLESVLCDCLKLPYFNKSAFYPEEVCRGYFKQIVLSKNFKKIKTKIQAEAKEEESIKSLTWVEVIRKRFDDPALFNLDKIHRTFLKVKFFDGEVKFIELPEGKACPWNKKEEE